jgi:hypothetical protein
MRSFTIPFWILNPELIGVDRIGARYSSKIARMTLVINHLQFCHHHDYPKFAIPLQPFRFGFPLVSFTVMMDDVLQLLSLVIIVCCLSSQQ